MNVRYFIGDLIYNTTDNFATPMNFCNPGTCEQLTKRSRFERVTNIL